MQNCSNCKHIREPITEGTPCGPCRYDVGTHTLSNWTPMAFIPNADLSGPAVQATSAPLNPPAVAGRKDDSGKLDVTLFFDDLPHAIEAVTEVLQWAVTKKQPVPYERGSWQGVEDFSRRYRGALLRHQLNRAKAIKADRGHIQGTAPSREPVDHETGLMELAHIATDALFLLEMALRKAKGLTVPEGA